MALVSAEKIELLSGSLIVIVCVLLTTAHKTFSSCLEPSVKIVFYLLYFNLISKNFFLKITGLVSDFFPCWRSTITVGDFKVHGAKIGIVKS